MEGPAPTRAAPDAEREFIAFFRSVADLFGLPKSLGEIYGLLYSLPEPVPMGEIMERLHLSKGSVSQGLKTLRALGAVRTTYLENDRKDHYVAVVELRSLLAGFLQHQIEPHSRVAEEHLARIRQQVELAPKGSRDFLLQRVGRLTRWQRRTREMLPLLVGLAGEDPSARSREEGEDPGEKVP